MSSPARPDTASMTAIRGLLERNLVERAVALAETRWPGSGPLVELAHEWAVLSPSARRERLASIGPEELARLRGIGQLQPDLARVLADLEARGIIPPESAVADETAAGPPVSDAPVTFEEAVVDAALDYSEEGLRQLATSVQENLPPDVEVAVAAATGLTVAEAAAKAAELERAAELARERVGLGRNQPVEVPLPELAVPSAEAFLAAEAERRQQAADQAASILDRVRTRVDQAADRLLPRDDAATRTSLPVTTEPVQTAPSSTTATTDVPDAELATVMPAAQVPPSTRVDSSMADDWLDRVMNETVIEVEPGSVPPADDVLQGIASRTGRDYVALYLDEIGTRAFFGGLVREGRKVEPRAGLFPTAVSQPKLVAVRGRLYPKAIERLREGFCDIPGTQATVRVHPESRIVVIPS